MEILDNPVSATRWCEFQRSQNRTIGYVPTMGALHAGHLSLIERAIAENDVSCVSIFVNPLQFNNPKDFASYPRDLQSDYRILEEINCDMVFRGSSQDMFPEASSIEEVEILDAGRFARGLEGEFRPGHLQGVCTVVDRLFRFVGNCKAYFGLKDYQQLQVILDLSARLGYPEIVACPTIRDEQGLALSSRNELLTSSQIDAAKQIFRALTEARKSWQLGIRDANALQQEMHENLRADQIRVDYAEIRDPCNWQPDSPKGLVEHAVALIAAYIGSVRLIDNLRLD